MEELIKKAKNEIPSLDDILDEAWNQSKLNKIFVNDNFGKVLISLDEHATKIFRDYEREALVVLAKSWLNIQKKDVRKKFENILVQKDWDKFIKKASQIFVEFGILVQNLEKDLGNTRKKIKTFIKS